MPIPQVPDTPPMAPAIWEGGTSSAVIVFAAAIMPLHAPMRTRAPTATSKVDAKPKTTWKTTQAARPICITILRPYLSLMLPQPQLVNMRPPMYADIMAPA
jgi:hypothetical protein